jgi:hypothetical protein
VTKEKESSEYWLRKDVKNAVENSLRVRGNDVSAFGNTPCNWIQNPEKSRESTAHEICTADIFTERVGVLAGLKSELVDDVEESDATFMQMSGRIRLKNGGNLTKGKVSPLVVANNESTNKTGYDHDPIDEDDPKDRRPWHASGQ